MTVTTEMTAAAAVAAAGAAMTALAAVRTVTAWRIATRRRHERRRAATASAAALPAAAALARLAPAVLALLAAATAAPAPAHAQTRPPALSTAAAARSVPAPPARSSPARQARSILATGETAPAAFHRWNSLIDAMTRTGGLVPVSRRPDRALPDRTHEHLRQYVAGVPVIGGGVSRQTARGATVSLFGAVFDGIDLDPTPALTAADAAARAARQTGAALLAGAAPELVILPIPLGDDYRLTWRLPMTDARIRFVDAATGDIVHAEPAARAQAPDGGAVGVGLGILGDRKKVAATWTGGRFQARDRTRPAEILTLDLDGATERDARYHRLVTTPGAPPARDVAVDADNEWTDPAIVDGHAHLGFTYDYFAQRHGRVGLDDRNGRLVGIVNARAANALYYSPPFGPGGLGMTVFGTTPDDTPIVAEDIVAHEATHGVVHAALTGRTGQPLSRIRMEPGPARITYRGAPFECGRTFTRLAAGRAPIHCRDGVFQVASHHGGAIDEAYADIFATAVEFFLHEAGDGPFAADYLIGEDVPGFGALLHGRAGPIRSLDDPASIPITPPHAVHPPRDIRHPDAYRQAVRFLLVELGPGRLGWTYFAWTGGDEIVVLPSQDRGAAHWNSTILSHAFRLAIEGGRHRTTGVTVRGAGDRQAVEAAFYRALVELMPPGATLFDAARVIHQSAVDLYGPSDDVTQAILSALAAVDLLAFAM